MSCISLRLPPAKKVWKSFTSKLGSKLHIIRKSKAMKKQRKNKKNTKTIKPSTTITTTSKPPPKFSLATKRFRRKKLATFRSVLCSFNKKPAPVYIDKLFKEPSCDYVGNFKPQTQPVYKPPTGRAVKDSSKKKEVMELEGTSKRWEKTSTSDDVWESVALGSPQMKGIDERAEEFIIRFRKQMAAQERLARSL